MSCGGCAVSGHRLSRYGSARCETPSTTRYAGRGQAVRGCETKHPSWVLFCAEPVYFHEGHYC
jgi:hypothetical protein